MKTLSSFLAKITLLSFCFLALAPAFLLISTSQAQAACTPACATGETCNSSNVCVTAATNGGTPVEGNSNDNALVDSMCNAMKLVTGNAGKAFAGFAIISLGIGFFTGKISWGLMIGVAMGIAGMFGAPTIVAALSGKGAYDCGSD